MAELPRLLTLWFALVSLLAFLFFGWDKGMAKRGRRRIPEGTLWAAALLGGGIGGWLGMRLFRHKTKKGRFSTGIPLLALAQAGLLVWVWLKK